MMKPSMGWIGQVRVPLQGDFFLGMVSHGVAMGCEWRAPLRGVRFCASPRTFFEECRGARLKGPLFGLPRKYHPLMGDTTFQ